MKTRNKTKSVLSALLAAVFLLGSVPQVTFAAQSSEYTDPADNWLNATTGALTNWTRTPRPPMKPGIVPYANATHWGLLTVCRNTPNPAKQP